MTPAEDELGCAGPGEDNVDDTSGSGLEIVCPRANKTNICKM